MNLSVCPARKGVLFAHSQATSNEIDFSRFLADRLGPAGSCATKQASKDAFASCCKPLKSPEEGEIMGVLDAVCPNIDASLLLKQRPKYEAQHKAVCKWASRALRTWSSQHGQCRAAPPAVAPQSRPCRVAPSKGRCGTLTGQLQHTSTQPHLLGATF